MIIQRYPTEGKRLQEEDRKLGRVSLMELKHRIDNKIGRILRLLGQNPSRNAQETANNKKQIQRNPYLEEAAYKGDSASVASTGRDMLNSRVEEAGELANSYSEIQEGSEGSSDSSTNQFLSVKVSDDLSAPDIFIYEVEKEESSELDMPKEQPMQPIVLRYCESRSEGNMSVDFGSRILEVPQEYEEDQEDEMCSLLTPQKSKPMEEINRRRSKTAQPSYQPQMQTLNEQSCGMYESKVNKSTDKIRQYNESHSSLCSVRKLMREQQEGRRMDLERKSVPEIVRRVIGEDCNFLVNKDRKESESSRRLRQALIAKVDSLFNRKRSPMQF